MTYTFARIGAGSGGIYYPQKNVVETID